MLADLEFKFDQHEETIRRAESNARLLAALTPHRPTSDEERPQRRLSTLLRRLAGTAYTAA
jgi:cytosine/adenosine deaminase-related metal-dependent hydrolase